MRLVTIVFLLLGLGLVAHGQSTTTRDSPVVTVAEDGTGWPPPLPRP